MKEQYLTVLVKVDEAVFKGYKDNNFAEDTVWGVIMGRVQAALDRAFSEDIRCGEMEISAEDWFECPVERAALDRATAREREVRIELAGVK
jgi:hypothetical protein